MKYAGKKQPRTFSLSPDVIEALERFKNERKLDSLTSAVEEIVREAKKMRLAEQVKKCYDALSDDEVAQEDEWGAFPESEI